MNGFATIKKHYDESSIDPIHLFSSLYKPKLQDKFKVWRMQSCFGLLGDKRKIKKIDFTGCPLPVSLKIRSVRNSRQQKEIWEMFQKVMEQKQQALETDSAVIY